MSMSSRKVETGTTAAAVIAVAAAMRGRRKAREGTLKTPNGYRAVLKRDRLDGGWVSSYPVLPGTMSQGETRAEALRNLDAAIASVMRVRNTKSQA